ncbi:uncharacterized protein LOC134222922 [Armigeres subalbatus]|uniref:uncharacterized protein LOC134222922 n=1 Tax=Armigeres subalbatus TaxID=124917 RepID=UPI002ECFC24D
MVTKDEKNVTKWLSGSWPLQPFDENLPLNKRKAEWVRFRNQFERIVACKEPVGAAMRLTGLKIFAGNYLLSVIETQELLCADAGNIYSATISALNSTLGGGGMCSGTTIERSFSVDGI